VESLSYQIDVSASSADESTNVQDIDAMIDYVREKESPRNCINAHCLFLSYLTHHNEDSMRRFGSPFPLIATNDFSIPPVEVLKHFLGRTFSKAEKNKIFKYLGDFLALDSINKMISAIEKPIDEQNKKQLEKNSIALAISYILARDESHLDEAHKRAVYNNSYSSRFFETAPEKRPQAYNIKLESSKVGRP
jgi:hypothetical protein